MILKPRPGRYRLHDLDSPEAEAVLAEVGIARADLDDALAALERSEGTRVRSIVGINHNGVFGARGEGWRPDLPGACAEPFIPVLWLQILELLGCVPRGSTARFREDGTRRTDQSAYATCAAAATAPGGVFLRPPEQTGVVRSASAVIDRRRASQAPRRSGSGRRVYADSHPSRRRRTRVS